jgi:hypothetical protein
MPTFAKRMAEILKDFKRNHSGHGKLLFVLSEEDMLTFTNGAGRDSVPENELILFGIPVVQGTYTHIEEANNGVVRTRSRVGHA